MIKTFISIGIIISLIISFLAPEIIVVLLSIKWSMIYYISSVLSRVSITVIMFEIAWGVVQNILRKF